MITIRAGLRRGDSQPYTITIDSDIFFITHQESSDTVEYNCFVNEHQAKKLKEILKFHLTNGKNVLY